jgi:2,4-dienoyl-CoA reductase-like NADH-dependent reductase (Old Yellow Enzyme family)
MRLLIEVVQSVRQVIPEATPFFVRISATDWMDNGWDLEQSVALAKVLCGQGVDLIDVSTGGAGAACQHPCQPQLPGSFCA